MKGMKLGSFSGIKKTQTETTKQPESKPEVTTETEAKTIEAKPVKSDKSEAKVVKKRRDPASTEGARERSTRQTKTKQKKEQVVTVNIKIKKSQKEWLADTASMVRENNTEPVPPAERVYPQHLIGVAIDLLQYMDVDWNEVKNVEQLRKLLKI